MADSFNRNPIGECVLRNRGSRRSPIGSRLNDSAQKGRVTGNTLSHPNCLLDLIFSAMRGFASLARCTVLLAASSFLSQKWMIATNCP